MLDDFREYAAEEKASLIEVLLEDIAISLLRIANVMDPPSVEWEDGPEPEPDAFDGEPEPDAFVDGPAPELEGDEPFDLVGIAKKFIALSGPSKAGDVRRYIEVATNSKLSDSAWTVITKSLVKTGDRATTRWQLQ